MERGRNGRRDEWKKGGKEGGREERRERGRDKRRRNTDSRKQTS